MKISNDYVHFFIILILFFTSVKASNLYKNNCAIIHKIKHRMVTNSLLKTQLINTDTIIETIIDTK